MDEIKILKIEDEHYPALLKRISNPPKVLYYRGEMKRDEFCLSVVGARNYSNYGKQVATEIVGRLTSAGLTIVSGLALGIDTFAHQVCVNKKKRTIAVLGTGLDEKSIYPGLNIGLTREIIKYGGCLISELPPGNRGSRLSLPARNRIISGLSHGVLVIEAKNKSGSLITAKHALNQDRALFAVPGHIYSANSAGTNKLIKRGAKLVDNFNDILEELSLSILESNDPRIKKLF
ncbi:MAG: DNA-processing protein DprA [Candidatus Staskawiczbacteria bacterium]|jgi:DNA processing protein